MQTIDWKNLQAKILKILFKFFPQLKNCKCMANFLNFKVDFVSKLL